MNTTKWLGSIVLRQPVKAKIAGIGSAVIVVFLGVFLATGEYTRKVHTTGLITPSAGAIRVTSPQSALLLKRYVKEGDHVAAGQLLFELTAEHESNDGNIERRLEASLKERSSLLVTQRNMQVRQIEQHRLMLLQRKDLLEKEETRLDDEISLQRQRVELAAKTFERFKALRSQGFISELQLAQYQGEYSDQQGREQSLRRSKLSSDRDLLQLKDDVQQGEEQIKVAEAQNQEAIANLEQESIELKGRSSIAIRAPQDGVVTTIMFDEGQSVSSNSQVATIIPASSTMQAELLVPSRAIGFVQPGQDVSLRIAAFPYQKFGQVSGKVIRIDQSPISSMVSTDIKGYADSSEPTFRIIVELGKQSILAYGHEIPYRTGMTLEAEIRQDRRRLIEWIIDPIVSVTKGRAG